MRYFWETIHERNAMVQFLKILTCCSHPLLLLPHPFIKLRSWVINPFYTCITPFLPLLTQLIPNGMTRNCSLSLSLSASVVASLWLLLKAEPVSERSKKILKLIFHLFPRHAPRAGPGRVKIVARRAAPLAAWVCISKYHVGARISVFYPLTFSFFQYVHFEVWVIL